MGFDKLNNKVIAGVCSDFYINSLYRPIDPIVFTFDSTKYNTILIDVTNRRKEHALNDLKTIWGSFFYDQEFNFAFMEDTYQSIYAEDISLSKVLLIISLAIGVISLIGILSLSALSCMKRTRELAIRQVFGASRRQVAFLVIKHLGSVFIVSFCISIPVIFFILDYWIPRYSVQLSINIEQVLLIEVVICVVTVLINWINVWKILDLSPATVIREN